MRNITEAQSDAKFVTVTLTTICAKGDVLQLDTTVAPGLVPRTMKRSTAVATGNPVAAGIAAQAGIVGAVIQVQVEGNCTGVTTGTATVGSNVMAISAHAVDDAVATNLGVPPLGTCLVADTGSGSTIRLLNPMRLPY